MRTTSHASKRAAALLSAVVLASTVSGCAEWNKKFGGGGGKGDKATLTATYIWNPGNAAPCKSTVAWTIDPVPPLTGRYGLDTSYTQDKDYDQLPSNNACRYLWTVVGLKAGKWRLSAIDGGANLFSPCEINVVAPDTYIDITRESGCQPHID